jgi:2-polyprenyl-3-methyl-5-hydroxy-6-metoxy-1,4-benzoquinol methylase
MEIIDNRLRHKFCPLCKSDLIFFEGSIKYADTICYSTVRIQPSKYSELWGCKNCESSFIQNAVLEQDSIKLYSQGSSEERWSNLPFDDAKTKSVVSKIKPLLNKGIKILDVGCGSGSFLDFAKASGCKTYGVEYSTKSLQTITQMGHVGFSELNKVDEIFDVITAFDVVEHLYDVPHFLEICKSKLSKDGFLILLTGNITCKSAKKSKSNWWYVQYPEHIVFPSKKFFMLNPEFELYDWMTTYHAPIVQRNLLLNFMRTFFNIVRKKIYNGYPSWSPDHYLVFLKKSV